MHIGRSFFATLLLPLFALATFTQAAYGKELIDLSLEELGNVDITSVSKRPEPLAQAAASVYVITNSDIQRSGATSLPEALRLAPNLEVARTGSNLYSISARGFNSGFANKLLVMIDGRTIYTPLFSGVIWHNQDIILEDIERIEVISGPGSTLWGSNAVNGVINIITKSADQTVGGQISVLSGTNQSSGSARYGLVLENGGHVRIYGKHTEYDESNRVNSRSNKDEARRDSAGFRADWGTASQGFTLQGDVYDGALGEVSKRDTYISGANILGRYKDTFNNGSTFTLQGYVDFTHRDEYNAYIENMTTVDVEFRHNWQITPAQNLTWGVGHREQFDRIENGNNFLFLPASKDLSLTNIFAQDEISLTKQLKLIVGNKIEHNNYTGTENLPTLRLSWMPTEQQTVWGAFTRSVRTPSRIDRDFYIPMPANVPIPLPYFLAGGKDFQSEISRTFEIGYRLSPNPSTTVSATAFYSEYTRLRSIDPVNNFLPFVIANNAEARSHGIELWGSWSPTNKLKFSFGMVVQNVRLDIQPNDIFATSGFGINDPNFYSSARISYDFTPTQQLDLSIRHAGELQKPKLESYTAVDVRYGWKINQQFDLSIIGQNLLDPSHAEYLPPGSTNPTEFGRTIFARLKWNFR